MPELSTASPFSEEPPKTTACRPPPTRACSSAARAAQARTRAFVRPPALRYRPTPEISANPAGLEVLEARPESDRSGSSDARRRRRLGQQITRTRRPPSGRRDLWTRASAPRSGRRRRPGPRRPPLAVLQVQMPKPVDVEQGHRKRALVAVRTARRRSSSWVWKAPRPSRSGIGGSRWESRSAPLPARRSAAEQPCNSSENCFRSPARTSQARDIG